LLGTDQPALSQFRMESPHGEVLDYLALHPAVIDLLDGVLNALKSEFTSDEQLALRLCHGYEADDPHLTVYVRQGAYDIMVINRIDRALEPLQQQLSKLGGQLLVTSDFRKPR
jgi:hypothetical protein